MPPLRRADALAGGRPWLHAGLGRAVAVVSGPDQAPTGEARFEDVACDVTIVAHDIGPVGGMERVLSELILGLRERGVGVTVIARTCELPAGSGVRFHRVRGPGRPFLLAYPWFLLAASLVVARRTRGVLQVTGGIVLNRADVVSVHYCHQVGPANPSRANTLYRANIRVVRVAKRLTERAAFNRNRGAVFACVSEGVAEEVREHYPRLASRVIAIHNGVDLERFEPGRWRERAAEERRRLEIGEQQLLALFVGGEWERKGLRTVIEALPDSPEWMLAVAGPGDRAHFEQLARRSGWSSASAGSGCSERSRPCTRWRTRSCCRRATRPSRWPPSRPPPAACRCWPRPSTASPSCSSRESTASSSTAGPRASREPSGSSRRTVRGCSRWAGRRAGPRCASAGRTRSQRHLEVYRSLAGGRRGTLA